MRDRIQQWYLNAWFVQNPDAPHTYNAEGNIEFLDPPAPTECEEPRSDGSVHYWLEPMLPNVQNACVIEQPMGNNGWKIGIFPLDRKMTSFGGL